MFICYICYDSENKPVWTVDIYEKPSDEYPKDKLYLTILPTDTKPDFDTLMALLHATYGCDIGELRTGNILMR